MNRARSGPGMIMQGFDPERLAEWTRGTWRGAPASPPVRVLQDTRTLRAGDLYVAIRGERMDGHDFVPDAFARGAVAAMVTEAYAAAHPGVRPVLVVADTRRALTDLARGHRAGFQGRIIGVTGSVGKSTTKDMLLAVLGARGRAAANPGNWNNELGLPLSLLAADPQVQFGIFEVGMNHPGELAPLCELLRPHWGVMVRVGPAHLEHFADERAIAEEKATLLRGLPAGGLAFLGRDEPWFDVFQGACACRVVTVSMSGAADYEGRAHAGDQRAMQVFERATGRTYELRLPQPGRPAQCNALRAVAVGREAGLEPSVLADALAGFRASPMRWAEQVVDGVRWINDAYNANPVSLKAALETFAGLEGAGGKWIVLGGMHELGPGERAAHEALGAFAARGPWTGMICVGTRAAWMAGAAAAAGLPPDRLFGCPDPAAAAALLRDRLGAGDAVLLKGSRAERVEEVLELWRRGRGA